MRTICFRYQVVESCCQLEYQFGNLMLDVVQLVEITTKVEPSHTRNRHASC